LRECGLRTVDMEILRYIKTTFRIVVAVVFHVHLQRTELKTKLKKLCFIISNETLGTEISLDK